MRSHSRADLRARRPTLWLSPPGQPKVLVPFQGFSELLGGAIGEGDRRARWRTQSQVRKSKPMESPSIFSTWKRP